jgi:hypothetical protein
MVKLQYLEEVDYSNDEISNDDPAATRFASLLSLRGIDFTSTNHMELKEAINFGAALRKRL